jgi:hypothetical protein
MFLAPSPKLMAKQPDFEVAAISRNCGAIERCRQLILEKRSIISIGKPT